MPSGYEPKPGTIAARVVAHLRALPGGREVQTNDLVKALDVSSALILTSVDCAIREGIIHRERRDDRYWWRVGPQRSQAAVLDWKAPSQMGPRPAASADFDVPVFPTTDTTPAAPTQGKAVTPAPGQREDAPCATTAPDMELRDVALGKLRLDDLEAVACAATARAATAEPHPQARFAMWSDGSLEIRQAVDGVLLTVDETRALLKYLETMAVEEGA